MIRIFFNLFLFLSFFSCSSEQVQEKTSLKKDDAEIKKQNSEWSKKSKDVNAEIERLSRENTSHNKGVILATRPTIQVDQEKFNKVYQEAVKGDKDYQYSLAMCYKYGYGVKEDKKKALYWFKKSADQGNKQAERVYKFMVNR